MRGNGRPGVKTIATALIAAAGVALSTLGVLADTVIVTDISGREVEIGEPNSAPI